MGNNIRCPRCNHKKKWKVRRNKFKCANCKYEWKTKNFPLRMTKTQWRKILRFYVLGLSSNKIAIETGIDKKRILRALNIVREVMIQNNPKALNDKLGASDPYIGSQPKNRHKGTIVEASKSDLGKKKKPLYGLSYRNGAIRAEIIPDMELKNILPFIKKKVKRGSLVCSDTLKRYNGIAAKGHVYRLVSHDMHETLSKGKRRINDLGRFWGYLKRNLAAKGGIRRERIPLYLAEYVWKFNNRQLSTTEKVNNILKLLYKYKSKTCK